VTSQAIDRISRWFESNCDGDWEHATRFQITNLDNPGWSLEASLAGTPLATRPFEERGRTRSERDWFRCWVESSTFHGVGGPGNLTELVDEFAAWIATEGAKST
jgi:hypothetical protein